MQKNYGTMTPRRLTLVIPSLDCGGAERVMVSISGALALAGHDVSLLTTDPRIPDFFSKPVGVKRLCLPTDTVTSCRWHNLPCQLERLQRWREAILREQPDLVISFLDTTNVATVMALSGSAVPVVAVEHNDPRLHPIGWRWEVLRRLSYPRAATVVMLTETTRKWALSLWPRWKVWKRPIPNPIAPPIANLSPKRPAYFGPHNLVGMGQLAHRKGFDLLIVAFARLACKHPDWHLTLFGEGSERVELERMATAAGLSGRIHLPGRVQNPEQVLPTADLFVLPSRYEGFPMVLTEAMVAGLPVISFECSSGPGEIVRNGVDGLLVPHGDVDNLTSAMDTLMGDEARRQTLGRRAPEVAIRFAEGHILDLWQELIDEIVTNAR